VTVAARLGLVVAVLIIAACTKRERPPVGARANSLADSADQILYGSKFTITDRGLRRADIKGDTSYFFHENTRIVLRPLNGTFYSSNGALDGIITARQGVYDTRLGVLEATGDVVVTSIDGKKLQTPFCRFDQRLNLISSDSTFLMSEPGRDLRGKGFKSDADLNTFSVTTLISSKAGKVALPER
jgi:LPS export ABC transporter protein LptC